MQLLTTKKIIRSLPNSKHPCNWIDYPTCIMNSLSKRVDKVHNCTLPFLDRRSSVDECSNPIALQSIKEMKAALKKQEYDGCLDLKSCNDVQFTPELFARGGENPRTDIEFYYKSFIIEDITDSYVYSFITIFSEVGGSIGILIGLSCMTIVDFFIAICKKIFNLDS